MCDIECSQHLVTPDAVSDLGSLARQLRLPRLCDRHAARERDARVHAPARRAAARDPPERIGGVTALPLARNVSNRASTKTSNSIPLHRDTTIYISLTPFL